MIEADDNVRVSRKRTPERVRLMSADDLMQIEFTVAIDLLPLQELVI